jgi:hypothetical protein
MHVKGAAATAMGIAVVGGGWVGKRMHTTGAIATAMAVGSVGVWVGVWVER